MAALNFLANGDGAALNGGRFLPPPKILDAYGLPIQTPGDQSTPLIPHAMTFGYILNTVAKTYSFRWDEALKHLPANALAMRRDCYLRSLLQERVLPTVNRAWQIVPAEDPDDPEAKRDAEMATQSTKKIRRFKRMLRYLMEAPWYGRYGAQTTWGEKSIGGGIRAQTITSHKPVNGDKIQGAWDDTPVVFINSAVASRYPSEYIIYTDRVPGLKLAKQSWREQFIIHTHEIDDADYFEGEMAGSVAGVGLRNWIYWAWWLRDEMLSWAVDFMKKAGALGLLIFGYEIGNKAAKAAAEGNAAAASKQTALVMPILPDGKNPNPVQHIQIPMNGVENLQKMIADYFEHHMERLIVGQTLSAGTEGSGLGGSGVAEMHEDTKFQLLRFDAENLAETLTDDYLAVWMRKNRPSAKHSLKWEFILPDPQQEKKISSYKTIVEMGGKVKAKDVYDTLGTEKPEDGEEVFGGQAEQGIPGVTDGPPGQEQPGQGQQDDGHDFENDFGPTLNAFDCTPELYALAAADDSPSDWRSTRSGRGEYSPSTGRWRPKSGGAKAPPGTDHAGDFAKHQSSYVQSMKAAHGHLTRAGYPIGGPRLYPHQLPDTSRHVASLAESHWQAGNESAAGRLEAAARHLTAAADAHEAGAESKGLAEHEAEKRRPKSVQELLEAAKSIPPETQAKADSWVSRTYAKLKDRYGSVGAKLVLAGMLSPIPGSLVGAPALAEGIRRLVMALKSNQAA